MHTLQSSLQPVSRTARNFSPGGATAQRQRRALRCRSAFRTCIIIGRCRMNEDFSRQARRFSREAALLALSPPQAGPRNHTAVWQGKSTQYDGRKTGQTACNACECRFLKFYFCLSPSCNLWTPRRTASDLDTPSSVMHSSNFLAVSLSKYTFSEVSLGLSVGRPIFLSLNYITSLCGVTKSIIT